MSLDMVNNENFHYLDLDLKPKYRLDFYLLLLQKYYPKN